MRVVLLATTTGYQTRAFGEAAERLGVDLLFATDRCVVLEDPWRDAALAIRFEHEVDSTFRILDAAKKAPIDGVLAVGDRPTVIAARVAHGLALPGHLPAAAAIARNKRLTRERLRDAGLPVPRFTASPMSADPQAVARSVSYPAVMKPLALSASRGVMRADDEAALVACWYRLRALMQSPDIRKERDEAHDTVLIESFIEGSEFALEGLMNDGELHVLAIFDKPDPLDGPFFEETLYVTPSSAPAATRQAIEHAVRRASQAIGLRHGPIHAECRVAPDGQVFVLEVAARPIGGLCARALRFQRNGRVPAITLEELLLRHALGESSFGWERETPASGVMMIPIPRRGVLRRVSGFDEARRVPGIEDVRITAKVDQLLVPLPEGSSYLGFIFSRTITPARVAESLRVSHRRLRFDIDPEVRVLQSVHG